MHRIEKKRSNIATFVQAYLLSLGALNQILGIVMDKSSGATILNLIPILILLAIHFFVSDKERDLNLDKKALLFVYYIVSVIVVYKYAFRYTTLIMMEIVAFCFLPIYTFFYRIDTEKLLKFMMILSILVLPVSGEFFYDIDNSSYASIDMSTTYNALPFVVAAILHFWYYRKNAGILTWICYGVNMYYLLEVVFLGNRGPVVSLIVLAVLLFLHKQKQYDGTMVKNSVRSIIITIIVGFAVIYVVNNFVEILYSVDKWFKSMGIEISALNKSIRVYEKGDLSNGRDWVFDFTIEGIKEHYLIGNGIGTIFYNSSYKIIYPHNLFLQLWYDLGIIVSIPMFWMIGKSTITTFFKNSIGKDYCVLMMLLFTLSIPRLCYSAEFWTTIPFWLLIMYTISPNIYEKKESTE